MIGNSIEKELAPAKKRGMTTVLIGAEEKVTKEIEADYTVPAPHQIINIDFLC